jgi:hypothetical protein
MLRYSYSHSGDRAVRGVGLGPLDCWNCEFESRLGAWMSVSFECCVLSARGLCVELITFFFFRGVLPSVVCLRMIVNPRQHQVPGILRSVAPRGKSFDNRLYGFI